MNVVTLHRWHTKHAMERKVTLADLRIWQLFGLISRRVEFVDGFDIGPTSHLFILSLLLARRHLWRLNSRVGGTLPCSLGRRPIIIILRCRRIGFLFLFRGGIGFSLLLRFRGRRLRIGGRGLLCSGGLGLLSRCISGWCLSRYWGVRRWGF